MEKFLRKKLHIIKTGATYEAIFKNFGDFDDFIINAIGISKVEVAVYPVYENMKLPDFDEISSVIITGSHSMVTDNKDWSVYLAKWLKDIEKENIPVLGICYGHQLLAQAFGGIIDYNPRGRGFGTIDISLTKDGSFDKLLGSMPPTFKGYIAHSQAVIKLPVGGKLLATNRIDPHHAFAVNDRIWGVQFHPEFSAEITKEYINLSKEMLENEGIDVESLCEDVQGNDYGKLLLRRFMEF